MVLMVFIWHCLKEFLKTMPPLLSGGMVRSTYFIKIQFFFDLKDLKLLLLSSVYWLALIEIRVIVNRVFVIRITDNEPRLTITRNKKLSNIEYESFKIRWLIGCQT
jgi:hypothetical protein